MEQNIHIRNKINEVNHNYQDLRRKAKRRIHRRVSLYEIERRRQELEIARSLGVDSFMGIHKSDWATIGKFVGTVTFVWVALLYIIT